MPGSTGTGRFLENIPSGEIPTFLVVDRLDGNLKSQIEAVIEHVNYSVKNIVAVDTGGDALYPVAAAAAGVASARATPDQDLRVLDVLDQIHSTRFDIDFHTAEVAVGIDSPDNAQAVLTAAQAQFDRPSEAESAAILARYTAWGMDGSRADGPFGKTALAWQSALRGATGATAVNIPASYLLDPPNRSNTAKFNPWNPYVIIQPSMAGTFIMSLDNHLRALGQTPRDIRLTTENLNLLF
jgi:hypothetical protein